MKSAQNCNTNIHKPQQHTFFVTTNIKNLPPFGLCCPDSFGPTNI